MRPIALLVLLASAASAATTFEQLSLPARALFPGLKAQAFTDRGEDSLIALLSDDDINVRIQAARSLKRYADSPRTQQKLIEVLRDSWQNELVRREAVKSLAYAQQREPRAALVELARDGGQSQTLRAVACQALWYAAAGDRTTEGVLRDLLSDGSQPELVRAGAAWGLFAVSGDRETRDALRERASDGTLSTPQSVRYEAARSLYLAMGDKPVAEDMKGIVEDGWAPLNLRQAAVLAFRAVNDQPGVADWLQKLAGDSSQYQLRPYALQALETGPSLELTRFFHLASYQGRSLDPLEGN